jgi:hypothetical protein
MKSSVACQKAHLPAALASLNNICNQIAVIHKKVSISNYLDSVDNPGISKFSESKEPPCPGIWKEKTKLASKNRRFHLFETLQGAC